MATIEQLQQQLDNRSLDPNTLSPKQKNCLLYTSDAADE